MKKLLVILIAIFGFECYTNAQSYQDWYNLGNAIGRSVRHGVEAKREREAEEQRRQEEEQRRQYEEQQRQYELERARAEQRAAEARAREAAAAEQARIRAEQEQAAAAAQQALQASEQRAYNESNALNHLLTVNNSTSFIAPDGQFVELTLRKDEASGKCYIYVSSASSSPLVSFQSTNTQLKVKYYDDPNEYSYSDQCVIDINSGTSGIDIANLFFELSSTKKIEDIKIAFRNSKFSVHQ